MVQTVSTDDPSLQDLSVEELKVRVKKLNSKAGQMKMDLHDLAEGLPSDFETLMDMASRTYEVYRQLHDLKQQLKAKENAK